MPTIFNFAKLHTQSCTAYFYHAQSENWSKIVLLLALEGSKQSLISPTYSTFVLCNLTLLTLDTQSLHEWSIENQVVNWVPLEFLTLNTINSKFIQMKIKLAIRFHTINVLPVFFSWLALNFYFHLIQTLYHT